MKCDCREMWFQDFPTFCGQRRVGSIEDLPDLNSLIQADIARWNAVKEAAAKGQRVQRQGWSIWHVKSATVLAGDNADQVLIPLLADYHYGEWVANQTASRTGKRLPIQAILQA